MSPKHSDPQKPRIQNGIEIWARAPYNFVPLPERVVAAPALPPLDQDDPNLLTGWIDCKLETCSPLYIRGMLDAETIQKFAILRKDAEQIQDARAKKQKLEEIDEQEKHAHALFFSTSQKKSGNWPLPVIPSSSLRGMVRSLVEIVSYSRMRWVANKPTFTYRAVAAKNDDPLRDRYREAVGQLANKVFAGYLRKDGDEWYIIRARSPFSARETQFGYIRVKEEYIGQKSIDGFRRFNSYNYHPGFFEVCFDAQIQDTRVLPNNIATWKAGSSQKYRGVLVSSGNMLESQGKQSKAKKGSPRTRHALVFGIPIKPADLDVYKKQKGNYLPIPKQVIEDYLAALTPFQEELTDWGGPGKGCLKDGAPVFFVEESGKIQYFGHSPNFRVPALITDKTKPGQMRASNPWDLIPEELLTTQSPDFTDAIFGWVNEKFGPQGQRAGRVRFSNAQVAKEDLAEKLWLDDQPITPHILANPKPTTFQHYLVQDKSLGFNPDEKRSLAHYGSPLGSTQIRGHKAYWHKGVNPDIKASGNELEHKTQLGQIMPVRAGIKFQFRIYFENLRPEELGALGWALLLPGESGKEYRHKLGMGKPLGMGAVALQPVLHLENRDARYSSLFNAQQNDWSISSRNDNLDEYLKAFEIFVLAGAGISREVTRLADVERIQQLLALLSWPGPDPKLTRYMEIEHTEDGKDYNEYKDRPVLPNPRAIWKTPLGQAIFAGTNKNINLDGTQSSFYRTGRVKKYGLGMYHDFGFIKADSGEDDIYVRQDDLPRGIETLAEGQKVRFRLTKGPKGWRAKEVEILDNQR